MKKLLHIIATPREQESRTLQVAEAFLESFKEAHPDWVVEELDLTREELPQLTMKRVDGKYVLLSGKELYGDLKEAWEDILGRIEQFLSADGYLISTPMWNFGIPYMLKHYFDVIVQPRYLFRYTAQGSEGLVKDRRMTVIASRGGDYTDASMQSYDFQVSYLRTLCAFIGITDVAFIVAQPMDMGAKVQAAKIEEARAQARALGRK